MSTMGGETTRAAILKMLACGVLGQIQQESVSRAAETVIT